MQIDLTQMVSALQAQDVEFMVIGGMHFLFRHEPILTYDLDIWIRDTAENRTRCHAALVELDASWGETEASWRPIAERSDDWLARQSVFSVLTEYGPLDMFRSVAGLGSWEESRQHAVEVRLPGGVSYFGLSDEDMLTCQEALPEGQRKLDRIQILRRAIDGRPS